MPFIKVVKNKAYFKRYQVKFRRRRAGKTDYRQRKRLVAQDKNKYSAPRYRLVVRFTNTKAIAQIVSSELQGDKTHVAAYSTELPRYGLKVGLKNYAAAYCTGLLCARRMLTAVGLADKYKGNKTVNGEVVSTEEGKREFWVAEVDEERRPFRAALDVGTRATTTGARVFGALKGASDGGLDVPHNHKRFPGYDKESKEYDASVHRDRIFGKHVATYMESLEEEDPAKFQKQFARYAAEKVTAGKLEELYTKVHAAIRAKPQAVKSTVAPKKRPLPAKKNLKQRQNRVQQKKAWRVYKLSGGAAAAGGDDDDDEDEEDDE